MDIHLGKPLVIAGFGVFLAALLTGCYGEPSPGEEAQNTAEICARLGEATSEFRQAVVAAEGDRERGENKLRAALAGLGARFSEQERQATDERFRNRLHDAALASFRGAGAAIPSASEPAFAAATRALEPLCGPGR